MSVNYRSAAHIGAESHHYYRQLSAPTSADPLQVGDLWSDTTADLLKRCTSVSPITFVSVEGGGGGHDLFSATHGDVDELDTPTDGQVLKYNLAVAKWRAEDDAAGHGDNAHDGTILAGLLASRPAAATLDRFFWATDEHILYRDNGAAWAKASVADHPDLDSAGPDDHHGQSHSDGDHTAGFAAPTGAIDIGDAAAEGAGATHSRSDHQHQFAAPSAGYPLEVAAAEADGTATTAARSDHAHAHGTGYSPDAHHARSHNHSQAADGDTLTPVTFNIPFAVTPAQTAEGQAVWDSDGDRLTVGTGAGRKTMVNGEDLPGGELGGSYDAPTVDAVHAGSAHHNQVAGGNALTLTGDTLDFDGGAAPAGELGGTWAAPTVDATHSGSAHHNQVAGGNALTLTGDTLDFDGGAAPAGELGGTWAAPTVDATHSGSAHHSADHAARHADGGPDELAVQDLASDAATDGQVAKADGIGGVAFEDDTVVINFIIDGGGSAITVGSKGHLEIPFAMTITGWTILANQSGSIVVDVNRSTYAGFPTLTSIAGTELPTLSAAQKNRDLTLTTWTTSIAAGDILEFEVDSAATVQRVTVAIRGRKT